MSISIRNVLTACGLLLMLVVTSDGSNLQTRTFDEEALSSYLEQREFQYGADAAQGQTWLARIIYRLTEWFFSLLSTPGGLELGRGFLYFLLGAVILVAIVLIIQMKYGKVLIGGSDGDRALGISLEKEENANYRALFADAQQSGQLQLAARYLFLLTLQQMSQRGLIQWKKWKTSHDYSLEVAGEKRQDYLRLSQFFESSWFGDHEPSTEELDQYLVVSKQLTDA